MSTLTTIQSTDLISNSRADLNNNFSALNTDKMETSVLDTDTTLAANSDAKVATQKAVKAYVDAGGNVNASETTKGISEEATDAEVTAGTATGGTGAKLFVTPAKLVTYLNSLDASVVPKVIVSTSFETAARFTAILDTGTNTFGTSGLVMDTTASGGRAAGVTMEIGSSGNDLFTGSPEFSATVNLDNMPTTGSSFFGVGLVTKNGTGHTYTTDHFGFKIIISGSVATLYGTQGSGTTESATAALTTVAGTDTLFLVARMNGTASIDYFYSKNGAAISSATNLTTNLPNTASHQLQFSISNNSASSAHSITVSSASYSR